MLYDHSTVVHLAWAVFAIAITYPLLFWFLRRVKGVPVRFNLTVFVALTAGSLLPLECLSYEANSLAQQGFVIKMMADMSFRVRDHMLVCEADTSKVPPEEIKNAAQRWANDTVKFVQKLAPSKSITPAEWLKLDNKCDGWVSIRKTDGTADFVKAATESTRWFIALWITGTLALAAIFRLAVRRIRDELREASGEDQVEINSPVEVIFFAAILLVGFVPFTLAFLDLGKPWPRKSKSSGEEKAVS